MTPIMTAFEKHVQSKGAKGETHFHVNSPMRFRLLGERVWRDAWVETMSLTEVLFHTSHQLEAGKCMDLRVMLPSPPQGPHGGVIVGHAKVQRILRSPEMPEQLFVSAALANARLLPFSSTRKRG